MLTLEFAAFTVGIRDGPSKFASKYLIKSRLSPKTLPLCSKDGTYNIRNVIWSIGWTYNSSVEFSQQINHLQTNAFVLCYPWIKLSYTPYFQGRLSPCTRQACSEGRLELVRSCLVVPIHMQFATYIYHLPSSK